MKKLLIFHPYLAPYRIDVYNRLAKMAQVKVLLTGCQSEIKGLGFNLENVNKLAQFKYEYYNKGFWIGRHLISFIYYKKIIELKPNIILSHELGVNTLMAICFKHFFKYKIFTTIDDSPAMATQYGINRNFLRKLVFSHIDGVLTVNPEVCDFLSQKYKKLKCQFIYFPIIQDDVVLSQKIEASKNVSQKYVKQFNLEGKKILLFVGRLEYIKSPDKLLEIYHKYIDKEESKLVIVGGGSLYEKLAEYIKINHLESNVILTGALTGESLYAWYYLAHIFILPSSFEPFGAVVNEALVAGCQTIVSNKVGASCLINKKNGKIFDIEKDDQLKNAISELLSRVPIEKVHQSLMAKTFNSFFNDLTDFMSI